MYHKEFLVFDQDTPLKAVIRNYTVGDFPELINVQKESFPPPFPDELLWNTDQLTNHITLFPEGALCIEIDGKVAGSMTGLLVHFSYENTEHSWEEITDNGYIRNHDPEGNTLYVVDIGVSPPYRKFGLGKWLMLSMYEVVIQLGCDRLLGGGRMPGYHKKMNKMTADEYLDSVVRGELKDPVITFLLRCGRTPVQAVKNYLEDKESCNYGALMEWKNPFIIK
ncbi:acetyltransferase [Mesobacillus campisalis]|uniref:Acetyltransferase n=1 Tax=Mesobacillus campisalis TaxID=1408103 RepID=A0A0M2SUE2_9BACI|nr:GNAT family N-acetyltransferase [Mesobacillus campisalis]KKK38204.1 acetyltransferase [Mesobacillus campisalis]